MFDDRLSIRVGAVVTMVLIVGVIFALQVDFRDLGPAVRTQVYLSHPGPLRSGAEVQLAGRKIGTIESIRLVTSNEARPPNHPLHPGGGVVLDMLVQENYLEWVRINSEFFVNMKGLIGRPYVEIGPPSADESIGRRIQEGDTLRGIDPARMENIIVTSFMNTSRFGELMREIGPDLALLGTEFSQLRRTLVEIEAEDGQYAAIVGSTKRAYGEYQELRDTFDVEGVGDLGTQGMALASLLRTEADSLQSELARLTIDVARVRAHIPSDVAAKLTVVMMQGRATINRMEGIVKKLEDLAEGVATAQGTIGALLADPEFMDDAKKLGRFLKRNPWKVITPPSP